MNVSVANMYGIIGMELFFRMLVIVTIMKRQKKKGLNQIKNRILFNNILKAFHSLYNAPYILVQHAKQFRPFILHLYGN
jgi:hypothetical protein